jgi:hypothetical protein
VRRAKQEEKRQRKTDREAAGETGPEMGEAQEAAAPAGVWEWFSPSRGRTVSVAANSRPPADGTDDWMLLTEVPPDAAPPA